MFEHWPAFSGCTRYSLAHVYWWVQDSILNIKCQLNLAFHVAIIFIVLRIMTTPWWKKTACRVNINPCYSNLTLIFSTKQTMKYTKYLLPSVATPIVTCTTHVKLWVEKNKHVWIFIWSFYWFENLDILYNANVVLLLSTRWHISLQLGLKNIFTY